MPSALPEQLVATARWMSEYYATHLATVLSTVIPAGITKQRKQRKNPPAAPSRSRTHFVLNSHQRAALEVLQANPTGTSILHGVTGSGKTAVYIEYARTHLRKGRSVTVLVPEIALTPQLVAEFRQHFPDVVVTHSRQTEAERHLSWLSVAQATTPQVIIGPRSALFMPVARLGAIIIDEAHEPSFKQEQSPRYSALRVASIIAQHHEAAVIQGTATPLVTEYFFASQTSRPIIRLPEKATPDMQAASTTVIDMTKRGNFRSHRFFSDALLSAMKDLLADNRQCLIYHNRRGSASTTLCEHCGWSAHCPRCFVPFTLHADLHTLRCHICGNKQSVPTSCPDCGSTDVIHKGIGPRGAGSR